MPPMVNMLQWSQEVEDLMKWYNPEYEETSADLPVTESKLLTDFSLFKDLPDELKLMIWGRVMPEARIIEVLWDENRGYYTDIPNIVPVILHICRMSRDYALEKLSPVEVENFWKIDPDFGPDDEMGTYKHEASLRFYINPNIDTLYMSMGRFHRRLSLVQPVVSFLRNLDTKVAENLQHIAMNLYLVHRVLDQTVDEFRLGAPLFSRFPKMKSIAMIISDLCMTVGGGGDDPRNFAPRREPIGMKDHDRNVIMSTFWNAALGEPETLMASRRLQDGLIDQRRSHLREGMIETGMDAIQARIMQFPLFGVVRGDVSWDGRAVKQTKIDQGILEDGS